MADVREYQICSRCVMDTSDSTITFDGDGVCCHCAEFDTQTRLRWHPDEEGASLWHAVVGEMQRSGEGHPYDCIIGLSGGVDSSYLAMKAPEWGLRPLVIHVNAGWNSDIATENIRKVVEFCNYDLHTIDIDWSVMRDLQVAYLRSGIPNQDVPQDHAFFASLFQFATRNRVRYVLSGSNIATEAISAKSWQGSAMDAVNIKAIHKAYGERSLTGFPLMSFWQYYVWYPFAHGMRTLRPLNFMPYIKEQAVAELESTIGWQAYGRKHGESRFTKLFQNYYLPTRFGFDKRRPHLSSLIVSGQMDRSEALSLLDEPLYSADELQSDLAFVCDRLGLSLKEYDELLHAPLRYHTDFPTQDSAYAALKAAQRIGRRITGRGLSLYS